MVFSELCYECERKDQCAFILHNLKNLQCLPIVLRYNNISACHSLQAPMWTTRPHLFLPPLQLLFSSSKDFSSPSLFILTCQACFLFPSDCHYPNLLYLFIICSLQPTLRPLSALAHDYSVSPNNAALLCLSSCSISRISISKNLGHRR